MYTECAQISVLILEVCIVFNFFVLSIRSVFHFSCVDHLVLIGQVPHPIPLGVCMQV